MNNYCLFGDCRDSMKKIIAEGIKVQTCVTSPPYWGLRDYGVEGQLGQEPTMEEYIKNMVDVFNLVWELLKDDGTLWLNLGDSYFPHNGTRGNILPSGDSLRGRNNEYQPAPRLRSDSLKGKDLCGIPWRVAFALQSQGWYLRSDIIWHKPNPMPESVTDRPTKSHEYLFLLTKRERYYYDQETILEPTSPNTNMRISQDLAKQIGSHRANGGGKTNGPMKVVGRKASLGKIGEVKSNPSFESAVCLPVKERNKRTVWSIQTSAFKDAHFATFPPKLIEPCILAGSRPGDIVFDPFLGSGTTAQVAQSLGRQWIGCELNQKYKALQDKRTAQLGMEL